MRQKLIVKQEGPILEIFNQELKKSIRYDLKTKEMFKLNESGKKWVPTKQQYNFFYGYTISDIQSKDEKFLKLIQLTAKINPGCKSVSSFISRMGEALIYEQYIFEGIEAEADVTMYSDGTIHKYLLNRPLNYYTKPIINFFKNYRIMVTRRIEEAFEGNYKKCEMVVQQIEASEIPKEKRANVFNQLLIYRSEYFDKLVGRYKYDAKSLFNYLFNYIEPFEAIEWDEAIRTLCDYYDMASKIGRNVKKYPKYLNSMHDIINANYNAYKRYYDEKKFKELANEKLIYEGKKFCIIIPTTTKDIIREGTDLNHCVGSYVDKILEKKCYIMFLREKEKKEESLVTVELIGKDITQAKGSYNRSLTPEEREFLEEYCKKQKFQLRL
jgi:hypothetical protein